MRNKVIILGLDGGTWELLGPLAHKGIMPNLMYILKHGVYAKLKSTIPPLSAPAWLSLATGRSPGKTGVVDFLTKRAAHKKSLHPISSAYYKSKSLWDYTSIFGIYTGVLYYPCLYPPYPIKGFMISGVGSPTEDDSAFYPRSLYHEVMEVIGRNVRIHIPYRKYVDAKKLMLDIIKYIDDYYKILLHLMNTKPWDLFIAVFPCTDWLQHVFWRNMEYILLRRDNENEIVNESIINRLILYFWKKLDERLGKIVSNVRKYKGILIIVSDHGFGPLKGVFNIPRYLESRGYMRLKLYWKIYYALQSLYIGTLKVIKRKNYNNRIAKIFNICTKDIPFKLVIDFRRSKIYTLGHSWSCGGLYVNRNLVKSVNELNVMIKFLLRDIADILGENNIKICNANDLYHGDKVYLLPDLLIDLDNYSYLTIENLNFQFIVRKTSTFKKITGSHRPDGIFIAYGTDIDEGRSIGDVSIYDVMPTVMHILGIPIPRDVDGRIIFEIFDKNSYYLKRKPRYVTQLFYKVRMKVLLRNNYRNSYYSSRF